MMTLSGNLLTLETGAPTLEDIAIGLSRLPRFAGQTIVHPWTVAHHSLVVEQLASEWMQRVWFNTGDTGDTGEIMLHALLHDAHEMMTGDIPTTFKTADTKLLQRGLDARLYAALGIGTPTAPQANAIKTFDRDALLAEARVVTPAATYERICREAGRSADSDDVEVVRDILTTVEDAALTFQQHAERLIETWRAI